MVRPKPHGKEDAAWRAIQKGLVLGLLLYPIALKYILQIWELSISTASSERRRYHEIGRSLMFIASLGFVLTVIVPLWMQFVQEFHMHPFFWVLSFVFSEPSKRLSLCIYWVSIICVSVFRFYNISKNSKIERILLRKYYHPMAVMMSLPALIFQPKFLDLAFGAALAVFLILEVIRVFTTGRIREPFWMLDLIVESGEQKSYLCKVLKNTEESMDCNPSAQHVSKLQESLPYSWMMG